jgi:hypothetical protein
MFVRDIESLTSKLKLNGYRLLKAEAEYCCFDSNKSIDKGWSDVAEVTDLRYLELLAFEAFLRRAAVVDGPFMAKGSMVFRQYLDDPATRGPSDLDFVCLTTFDDPATAEAAFTAWMVAVSETNLDDDIRFRSFRENTFWRRIDYAMHDDFPTTNTELMFYYGEESKQEIHIDISWNLPLGAAPVPLIFKTLGDRDFQFSLTVPLVLQISWKLHQTTVNCRAKDLMDLVLLLEQRKIDGATMRAAVTAYVNECKKDNIRPEEIIGYIDGQAVIERQELEAKERQRWEEEKKVNAHPSKPAALNLYTHAYDLPALGKNWTLESEVHINFVEVSRRVGLTTAIREIIGG